MKYIFLFEDGAVKFAENITDDDKLAISDGVLDVISINEDIPKIFNCESNTWEKIEQVEWEINNG